MPRRLIYRYGHIGQAAADSSNVWICLQLGMLRLRVPSTVTILTLMALTAFTSDPILVPSAETPAPRGSAR